MQLIENKAKKLDLTIYMSSLNMQLQVNLIRTASDVTFSRTNFRRFSSQFRNLML